jgi:hypothetical protein
VDEVRGSGVDARGGVPVRFGEQLSRLVVATTVEVPEGHLAMISHPAEVAELITTAAQSA